MGNCVLDANQSGNADYLAAPQVQQTVVIGQGPQTVTPSTPPSNVVVGSPAYTPTGIGGGSGNPVVVVLDPSSTGCTLSTGVVSFGAAGTCIIDFNQSGNADYTAAPQVQQTIVIGQGSQTITFTPPAAGTVGGGTTLSATGGASGNPVTFTVDPSSTVGTCSLVGTMLSFASVGNCVVDANQSGNADYTAAPQVQQTIVIGQGSQTITFTPPAAGTVGGGTTLSATGGASGNPVTFTIDPSSTVGTCSLVGAALSYTGVGSCVVDANQSGNADYTAAPQVQQTIVIGQGSQTITPSTPPTNVTVFSPTYTPTGTGGGSGNPVVVVLDPSSTGCTLSAGVVTFASTGTCAIDFNQAGSANYSAAPQVQQSIAIGSGIQTITFTPPATGTVGGGATLTATGGASGNPVTFTIDPSTTSGACSLVGTSLSYTRVGNCVVDANQSGDAAYLVAPQVQQTIVIGQGAQTITPSTPPTNVTILSPTYTPTDTGGASGNPVVVVLDPSSTGCTMSAGIVTFASTGTCVIDFNQAGDADYSAASQVQQSITIGQGSQTITFTPPATGTVGGGTTLSASGGPSGNPVTFTIDPSSTSGACSLVGTSLSYTGVGSCLVDANQSGDAAYSVAPQVQQTIVIGKGTQTITPSTAPTNVTVETPTYRPTGAGGASGNPVVVTLDPSSTGCTLQSGAITFAGIGTCIVDFNQAGNSSYGAAPVVRQSIAIGLGAQRIVFNPPASATVGGRATLSGTGGPSGRPVILTIDPSSTAGACNVVGSVLSFTGVGSCVVDANQSGDADYSAAPQVRRTIVVRAGSPVAEGYRLPASDGGVFAFGADSFLGSLVSRGVQPTAPISGMAATRDGNGYWLVGVDGNVYTFGDARLLRDTGLLPLPDRRPHCGNRGHPRRQRLLGGGQ